MSSRNGSSGSTSGEADSKRRTCQSPLFLTLTDCAPWFFSSPETITALEEERAAADAASPITPNSPRPPRNRRRSSTGPISPALRPVLIDRDDDGGASDDAPNADGEEGPAPVAPHEGPAIDEVELVFNQ